MRRLEIVGKFSLALASTMLLLIGGVMIPPAGILLIPLVPQPVLSFGLRYGIRLGMAVLITGTLLLFLFAGAELGFIYLMFASMVSLLFASLGRIREIERIVFGVAAIVFGLLVGSLRYLYGSWSAMLDDVRDNLTYHLNAAVGVQERMGFPHDSLETVRERMPAIVDTMLQILPGLVFVMLGLVVLVNLILIFRQFPERREEWLSGKKLREWNAPEPLVWVLIVCGFSLFVPGLEFLNGAAINILLVSAACYFFQGLAIVAYFFHQSHVPVFLRTVTYVLIIFQQIFTLLVVGLGLFDLWGDFRRLKKPSQVS